MFDRPPLLEEFVSQTFSGERGKRCVTRKTAHTNAPLYNLVFISRSLRLEAMPVQHRWNATASHEGRVGSQGEQGRTGPPCQKGAGPGKGPGQEAREKGSCRSWSRRRPNRGQKTLLTRPAWKSSASAAQKRTKGTKKNGSVPRPKQQRNRKKERPHGSNPRTPNWKRLTTRDVHGK